MGRKPLPSYLKKQGLKLSISTYVIEEVRKHDVNISELVEDFLREHFEIKKRKY